jgi:hypothetical protein
MRQRTTTERVALRARRHRRKVDGGSRPHGERLQPEDVLLTTFRQSLRQFLSNEPCAIVSFRGQIAMHGRIADDPSCRQRRVVGAYTSKIARQRTLLLPSNERGKDAREGR